jgi:hypothetical protein
VIAENREHSEWRVKIGESRGGGLRRHELPARDSLNDKVSKKHDEIRAACIDARDDLIQLLDACERRSNVKVRDDCDSEWTYAPARESQSGFTRDESLRLPPERPDGQRERDETNCHDDPPQALH